MVRVLPILKHFPGDATLFSTAQCVQLSRILSPLYQLSLNRVALNSPLIIS